MIINCKSCNSKNKVNEVITLKDNETCENRMVFKSFCNKCNSQIGLYLEIRKCDKKAFFKNKNKTELKYFLNREKRNIFSLDKYNNCTGWRYGINKEVRNKKGKILKIRQYGADFKSNKAELERELVTS